LPNVSLFTFFTGTFSGKFAMKWSPVKDTSTSQTSVSLRYLVKC